MNKSTGIHCKVICEDQMRRFQFPGTEFSSLQHQVNQLLGLSREFVLKYKDNEGDMITISSTEELSCATEISQKENGGIIRLTVFFNEPSSLSTNQSCEFPKRGRGNGGKWGHGHGVGCPGGGPRNPYHFQKPGCQFGGPGSSEPQPWKGKRCHGGEPPCKNRFERRKNKLMFKRDMLKAYLSSLEQVKELSPEEERKKQIFQAKVQRIDSILSQFFLQTESDCPPEKPKSCSQKDVPELEFYPKYKKCHRKFEKKEKKFEKKEHKEETKNEKKEVNLSEETKTEIMSLKNQIKELKPAIWAIDEQLKTKKAAARQSFENGQFPGWSFKGEIIKLKQEKRAIKEKIAPLSQRIHHLKAGGK